MTQTLEEQVEDIRNKYKLKDNTIYCADDIEFVYEIKQALRTAEKRGARNLAIQIQAYHEAYVGDEMEKKNFVVGTMGLVKEALTNITK